MTEAGFHSGNKLVICGNAGISSSLSKHQFHLPKDEQTKHYESNTVLKNTIIDLKKAIKIKSDCNSIIKSFN